MKNGMILKIKNLFNENKKVFILIVSLSLFVVFLFISFAFPTNKKSKKINSKTENVSVLDYATSIENKLNSMLINVSDVNYVLSFVMVDSTPQNKYLTQNQEQSTTNSSGNVTTTKTTTIVFEKNGSISTPIVETVIMPKVSGVMIVVNKISPSTKINIINAISIVLNVDSKCISILERR